MELTPVEFFPDDGKIKLPQNKPYICRPQQPQGTTAALLIHGFTGTPWEMVPQAKSLAAAGITSVAVRLPGHGTAPEDLARRRYEEWVAAVELGHLYLRRDFSKVIAVGLSTGAMVALRAHLAHPFNGLALLSPYLRVRNRLAPLAGLLRFFIKYQHRLIAPGERPYYYSQRPIEGIHQLNRLVRSVKGRLNTIKIPTLVACADGDQTVDPDSAVELYQRLGSPVKELHRYGPDVPHVLTSNENPKQREVLSAVRQFVIKFRD